MILLAITFRLLDAVKLFDTIFIMTGGGPGTKTYTASFYLYTVGFTAVPPVAGDRRKLDLPDPAPLLVIMFLVRRLLGRSRPDGHRREPLAAGAGGRASDRPHPVPRRSSLSSCWRRSTGCSSPRSSRATTISPCRRSGSRRSRRSSTTPRRCSPIAASHGLINSLIISLVGDGALGLLRHADGLQPGALQHRRPAPLLLGAVAALPAADRHRPADLPASTATLGLHDTHIGLILAYTVFTLPVSVWMMFAYFRQHAAVAGGGGAGRRLHALAGVLARRGAARRAGHRRGRRLRLHRLLDRVLLRADPDQPQRLHAADGLPRLPRLPGRAIWRGERARDRLAGAVDRRSACWCSAISCAG